MQSAICANLWCARVMFTQFYSRVCGWQTSHVDFIKIREHFAQVQQTTWSTVFFAMVLKHYFNPTTIGSPVQGMIVVAYFVIWVVFSVLPLMTTSWVFLLVRFVRNSGIFGSGDAQMQHVWRCCGIFERSWCLGVWSDNVYTPRGMSTVLASKANGDAEEYYGGKVQFYISWMGRYFRFG